MWHLNATIKHVHVLEPVDCWGFEIKPELTNCSWSRGPTRQSTGCNAKFEAWPDSKPNADRRVCTYTHTSAESFLIYKPKNSMTRIQLLQMHTVFAWLQCEHKITIPWTFQDKTDKTPFLKTAHRSCRNDKYNGECFRTQPVKIWIMSEQDKVDNKPAKNFLEQLKNQIWMNE